MGQSPITKLKGRGVDTNLVIKQSHLGTRMRFEFGLDKLTETITDGLGERTFTMPYLNICTEDVERIALKSRRPTAYLWSAAAPVVFAGMRAGYDVPMFGAIVGALGFGMFFFGILADISSGSGRSSTSFPWLGIHKTCGSFATRFMTASWA